jgi:hypothetical protein
VYGFLILLEDGTLGVQEGDGDNNSFGLGTGQLTQSLNGKKKCTDLHIALCDADSNDINSVDLTFELRVLQEIIPCSTDTALQALRYLKSLDGSSRTQK